MNFCLQTSPPGGLSEFGVLVDGAWKQRNVDLFHEAGRSRDKRWSGVLLRAAGAALN